MFLFSSVHSVTWLRCPIAPISLFMRFRVYHYCADEIHARLCRTAERAV